MMLPCLVLQTVVAFWCVRSVNGVLMLGMSAATPMAIVQYMITPLREARADTGLGGRP